jgi:hypothetical protein
MQGSLHGYKNTHQWAFDAIKGLVLSRDCLTSINHHNPGKNKIFITCDASKQCTGTVLAFGETWETAQPVAFNSRQLKGSERHYPVHEQELLSIMCALAKWWMDLLGTHVYIIQTTKHSKILICRETYPSDKPGGWNIYPNMNIR